MSKAAVLIVDEEPALLESAVGALSDEGYAATGINSGRDALTIISSQATDLLLTAFDIPDIDGLDLVKRALLINPQLGTVLMVNDSSQDMVIRALKAGVQSILTKPFEKQELAIACNEALEKSEFLKQNIRLKTLMPLFEVSKCLVSELRTDKLFQDVVHTVCLETKADVVALMLLNEPSKRLVIRAGIGLPGELLGREVDRAVDWLPYSVVDSGKPALVKDRLLAHNVFRYQFASLLLIPLVSRGRVIGVLKAGKSNSKTPFTECDLELLSIIAGQAAIAIENARLFDSLRVEKSRLSGLMKKHLRAQEDERCRISDELHDSVAQWMVSASYYLQSSKALIAQSMIEEANIELDHVKTVIEQCVREIRRIITNCRPQILSELGLVEALKHDLQTFQDETGIVCHLTVEGNAAAISWAHNITIYRVIAEALSNIRKHAYANEVDIRLSVVQNDVVVEVVDNGTGFDFPAALERGKLVGSVGLVTMQERAEAVNGKLQVESTRGVGTKISLLIPLQRSRSNGKKNQRVSSMEIVGGTR